MATAREVLTESIERLKSLFYRAPIPKSASLEPDEDHADPWYSWLRAQRELPWDRRLRYRDYDDMCVTGETKVKLLNGTSPTIEELFQEHGDAGSFYVYSYDHALEDVTVGHARCSSTSRKVVLRVELDNGELVRCSPDHKFLLRTGEYAKAKDLKPGDSLMPLLVEPCEKGPLAGYLLYTSPSTGRRHFVHHMAHDQSFGVPPKGWVRHHVDFNHLNNDPRNLLPVTQEEHGRIHQGTVRKLWENPQRAAEALERLNQDPVFQAKRSAALRASDAFRATRRNGGLVSPAFSLPEVRERAREGVRQWLRQYNRSELQKRNLHLSNEAGRTGTRAVLRKHAQAILQILETAGLAVCREAYESCRAEYIKSSGACARLVPTWATAGLNHQVVSVREDGYETMYDLYVEDYHNYALESGIFVHNSNDVFVGSAIEIYAEEACQFNREHDATIWIKTPFDEIGEAWEEFVERIKLEDHIHAVAMDLSKYGDDFQKCLYNKDADPGSEESGLLGVQYVDPNIVERDEDRFGRLTGFRTLDPSQLGMQLVYSRADEAKKPGKPWKPWDFVHFRILGRKDVRRYEGGKYGFSMIENARRIYKQLATLEDSLQLYRLHRSGGQRVFYIDVGQMGMRDALNVVKLYKRTYNSRSYVNRDTGEYTQRHAPHGWNQDLFWPVRTIQGKESASRIELLGAGVDVGSIEDIDYFRRKMFAALKVPAAYLGFEADLPSGIGGNSARTLSQQDVRFARSVKKLQRALIQGYSMLFRMHLALRGLPTQQESFDLVMTVVSILEEQDRLEAMAIALEIADRFTMTGASLGLDRGLLARWILINILFIPQDELEELGWNIDIARASPLLGPLGPPGNAPPLAAAGLGLGAGRAPGGTRSSAGPVREHLDRAIHGLLEQDPGLRREVRNFIRRIEGEE